MPRRKTAKIPLYVCTPKVQANIFRTERNYWTKRHGGLRGGSLTDLASCALVGVCNIDLTTPLHLERLEDLFKAQQWPGMVRVVTADSAHGFFVNQDDIIAVRWKTFERWVHTNAERLVKTKAEVRLDKLVLKKR